MVAFAIIMYVLNSQNIKFEALLTEIYNNFKEKHNNILTIIGGLLGAILGTSGIP